MHLRPLYQSAVIIYTPPHVEAQRFEEGPDLFCCEEMDYVFILKSPDFASSQAESTESSSFDEFLFHCVEQAPGFPSFHRKILGNKNLAIMG